MISVNNHEKNIVSLLIPFQMAAILDFMALCSNAVKSCTHIEDNNIDEETYGNVFNSA